jgi:hypothetical protein
MQESNIGCFKPSDEKRAVHGLESNFGRSREENLQAMRLYREFKVTAAGKAWRARDYSGAVSSFKQVARACIDSGDTDRAMQLLDKMETAANPIGSISDDTGNYAKYVSTLQSKLEKAFNDKDINHARDLLKKMIVISKNLRDANLFKSYKGQLLAVEAVYKGKGSRHVPLEKIMRARLIEALHQATDRTGLAVLQANMNPVKPFQPWFVKLQERSGVSISR